METAPPRGFRGSEDISLTDFGSSHSASENAPRIENLDPQENF